MSLKIERGVPIPSPSGRTSIYDHEEVLKRMQPGDSVVVKYREAATLRVVMKNRGWKVVTRTVKKDSKNYDNTDVRVWRVS